MARPRRGGFRPPELRGTLGTLLRTTLQQAGAVRDALERGAREGRSRLDDALAGRRRHDALAELGERVLSLIRQGEIALDELPELHDVVAHLDDLDARASASGEDASELDAFSGSSSRARFDARGPRDDGTVSSSSWRGPSPAPAPGGRDRAPTRVWRPGAAPSSASPRPAHDAPDDHSAGPPPTVRERRPPPAKRGGISFDDDDDLADYMHPDDVPPKRPPDDES
jgi:hypothetical protein